MSEVESKDLRGLLRRSLARIEELERALAAKTERRTMDEPIAIVGMGCRFPGGADSPAEFWRVLTQRVHAVREIPAERWPVDLVASEFRAARWAGLLDRVDRFDAEFFGISPREAVRIDPQQRLLLEVAYEALERSGPASDPALAARTGTYVGVTTTDYMDRLLADGEHLDAQSTTGNGLCFAAGRLAYSLGLEGPALALDTACSSSLVAVHTACEALRMGECDRALAGGVNLLLSPTTMRHMARTQALSSDGRCRTFDARANGYVRAEGCGMLVLRRLRDAQERGEPILALIRGSAVNQDGRSSGITAPNALAQQRVMRAALKRAGVAPEQVGFVETHGTGTPMGDPVEAEALRAVYGRSRSEGACWLGAVKTNVGHLEAAAGVAGLIKAVLVLQHGAAPPNLHFERLNPRIELGTGLRVADRASELHASSQRFAAVSSFGISGTNAHVVLEALPAAQPLPTTPLPQVLTLSARTSSALRSRASRLLEHVTAEPALDLGRLCHAANVNHEAFEYRWALTVREREQLVNELRAASQESGRASMQVPSDAGKVALLFSGRGRDCAAAARQLSTAFPVCKAVLDRCAEHYLKRAGHALFEAAPAVSGLQREAALFAVQQAAFALYAELGLTPDAVMGYGLGEIGAACAAGVFTLEAAFDLVIARAQAMEAAPLEPMLRVRGPLDAVHGAISGKVDVAIAGYHTPREVLLAGLRAGLDDVARKLSARGLEVTSFEGCAAPHLPFTASGLEAFEGALEATSRRAPRLTFISAATGSAVGDELAGARYWRSQARSAVQWSEALRCARELGVSTWVELGGDQLLAALRDHEAWDLAEHCLVPSLLDASQAAAGVLDGAAKLFERGVPLRRDRFVPSSGVTPAALALPTYPFERESYWIDAIPAGGKGEAVRTHGTSVAKQSPRPWTYRVAFMPHELSQSRGERASLVVLGAGEEATALAERLAELSGDPVRQARPEELPAALAGCAAGVRVLYVAPQDVPGDASAGLCGAALETLRTVSASQQPAKLWWVTRGAQRLDGQNAACRPEQAALWGLGRVAALEQPACWGGLIDLEPGRPLADQVGLLLRALECQGEEDQFVVRAGAAYVARLVPSELASKDWAAPRADRIYLITGGLGGLGLALARWLVRAGARRLVLTGRSAERIEALAPEKAAVVETLRQSGADVRIAAVDVSRREEVERLLASLDAPLAGIFHTAGVLSTCPVLKLGSADVEAAMGAKLNGALHLDALTRDQSLDWFVLFSSAAGIWGGEQQGHYASASHALDALAASRRAESLPALSVDWGYWKDGGMGGAQAEAHFASIGLRAMDSESAIAILDSLLQSGASQAVVADVDWGRFRAIYEARKARTLLKQIHVQQGEAQTSAIADELLGLPRAAAHQKLAELVCSVLARIFKYDPAKAVDRRRGFNAMGMDSLMAVELSRQLGRELGLVLPTTVGFDHPTVEKLTFHLLERLTQARGAKSEPALSAATVSDSGNTATTLTEPIAVIGAACRLPGDADDIEALWQLLMQGRDVVTDAPDRWRVHEHDPALVPGSKMYSRVSSSLRDVASFDAELFRISPREALTMDPQQRVLLEVAWEALEHAGCAPDALAETKTGVFIGVAMNEYQRLVVANDPEGENGYGLTGNGLSFVAGRVSYVLGLQGPSVAVDTACSSSLAAVHLACQSLRTGESQMALAGAANLTLLPDNTIALCQMQALSRTGRCRTFDAAADGFVRGEGSAVLVLKRLSDAQASGDNVLAVIRGTALNHDGASSGFTVPNGPAQQAVIRSALASAGVAASEVGYVEAHGTGTVLGDPIEMQALSSVYGTGRSPDEPLLVGSLKTNFGHLEVAAGVVGLLKAILCVQRGYIPAHLHFENPSPHIPWRDIAVRVPAQGTPWPSYAARRLAGVSAFGMSGTNVHVVVEAPPQRERSESAPPSPAAWPLSISAQTRGALVAYAERLADWLEAEPERSLDEVAHALLCRRARLPQRVGFTARSAAEATAKLRAFARDPNTSAVQLSQATTGAAPRVAFLFTGQGAQYVGMAQVLYERYPSFRAQVDRADIVLKPVLGRSLLALLYPRDGKVSPELNDTEFAQPALLACAVAIASLWREFGVEPTVVLGHSIGELAAACVAGAFSFEQGLLLVASRGRLMQGLPDDGAMAAVFADADTVRSLIAHLPELTIAAFNGPSTVALSGSAEQLEQAEALFRAQGIRAQRLKVSHAFHSNHMAPIEEDFERALEEVSFAPVQVPLISTVTGALATEVLGVAHWRSQLQKPVLFWDALNVLSELEVDAVLEIGPEPVLLGMLGEHPALENVPALVSAARRDTEGRGFLESALALHGLGLPIAWGELFSSPPALVQLPPYAFERARYWIDERESGAPELPIYRQTWVAEDTERAPHEPLAGSFLVLSDHGPLAQALADKLAASGVDVEVRLRANTDQSGNEPGVSRAEAFANFVFLCSAPSSSRQPGALAAELLAPLQGAILGARPGAQLWFVTQDAHAATPDPEQAAIWGLLRSVALEHPELRPVGVDLGSSDSMEAKVDALVAELSQGDEREVVRAGEQRKVRRLRVHATRNQPPQIDAEGVYVLSGGRGALGQYVARWLVERGARHLCLLGRSPADASSGLPDWAAAAGAAVQYRAVDVSDRDAVAALLQEIRAQGRPIRGVVHAAGVLDDGLLLDQSPQRFATVAAPKVKGALVLSELTVDEPLQFFALFSSMASVLGSAGQAGYAVANAYLDALAAQLRARGVPAISIQWGPWEGGGMAARISEGGKRAWTDRGVRAIQPKAGLEALGTLLSDVVPDVAVMPLDFASYLNAAPHQSAFLSELTGGVRSAARGDLLARVAEAAPEARLALCLAVVVEATKRVVHREGEAVLDPNQSFRDMGMDSLMALELRNVLRAGFDLPLTPTEVFNHPSPEQLARYLHDTLWPKVEVRPAAAAKTVSDVDALSEAELVSLLDASMDAIEGASA